MPSVVRWIVSNINDNHLSKYFSLLPCSSKVKNILPVSQQLLCASLGRGYLLLQLCQHSDAQRCELVVPVVWAGHMGGWSMGLCWSNDELGWSKVPVGEGMTVLVWSLYEVMLQPRATSAPPYSSSQRDAEAALLLQLCWGVSSQVETGLLRPWHFIPFSCIYTAVVPDGFLQCKGLTGPHGSRLFAASKSLLGTFLRVTASMSWPRVHYSCLSVTHRKKCVTPSLKKASFGCVARPPFHVFLSPLSRQRRTHGIRRVRMVWCNRLCPAAGPWSWVNSQCPSGFLLLEFKCYIVHEFFWSSCFGQRAFKLLWVLKGREGISHKKEGASLVRVLSTQVSGGQLLIVGVYLCGVFEFSNTSVKKWWRSLLVEKRATYSFVPFCINSVFFHCPALTTFSHTPYSCSSRAILPSCAGRASVMVTFSDAEALLFTWLRVSALRTLLK